MSDDDQHSRDDERPGEERTTALEYALGALGGVLVLCMLGFLLYQAVAVRETGPQLEVTVTGIEEAGSGYAVHFRVSNDGGRTAETVQVSGTLTGVGERAVQATTSMGYVPPASSRSGALLFPEDPRAGRLEIRPSGYTLP